MLVRDDPLAMYRLALQKGVLKELNVGGTLV